MVDCQPASSPSLLLLWGACFSYIHLFQKSIRLQCVTKVYMSDHYFVKGNEPLPTKEWVSNTKMWQVYRGQHFRVERPLFFLFSNLINIYRALMFLTKLCAFIYVGSLNPHKNPLKEVLASSFYRWENWVPKELTYSKSYSQEWHI